MTRDAAGSRLARRRPWARLCALALLSPLLLAGAVRAQPHGGGPERWPDPHPPQRYGLFLVDQLEYAARAGDDALAWDVDAWYGSDRHRLVLESEGERRTRGLEGELDVQLLYGRPVTPFWDLHVGVRQEILFGPGTDRQRRSLVLGFEGLAPQWIELEPRLFVSDDGDASLRLEATHELFVTQRLVAQSQLELEAAIHDARRFGVESGMSELELGLRVRYEMERELAPYLGICWTRKLGATRDLARDQGEDTDEFSVLAGVRFWF